MNVKLIKALTDMIEKDILEEKIFGAAVRVVEKENSLVDLDIGVSKNDLFRLASMTKPITAVAILIAEERGLLHLGDSVKKYLPEYADMTIGKLINGEIVASHKAENEIKIFHLLSHTSGILCGDMGEQNFPEVNLHRNSLEQATSYYPKTLLAFEPFTQESYSPLAAFDIAARIIELVSSLEYDDFLRQYIFAPLDIKDTGFSLSKERRERLTPMHAQDKSGHSMEVHLGGTMGNLPDTYFSAGGGLAGSADDYLKFALMLLHNGAGLLKPESVNKMASEVWPGWGLGVRIVGNDPYLNRMTYGWSGAYGTHFFIDPSQDLVAIYMKNSMYDGGSGAQSARAFERLVMQNLVCC